MEQNSDKYPESSKSKLSLIRKFIIGLTLFTGLSHIIFSYGWENEILGINLGVWFIINGLGYIIILYFLYFSSQSKENKIIFRYALFAWTLGSIFAWALFHTSSERYDTLLDASLINKSVEVLILFLLYLDTKSIGKS